MQKKTEYFKISVIKAILPKHLITNSHRSYLSLVYGSRNLVSLLGQMLSYYYYLFFYTTCAAQYYNIQ